MKNSRTLSFALLSSARFRASRKNSARRSPCSHWKKLPWFTARAAPMRATASTFFSLARTFPLFSTKKYWVS